jgi:hypothetical protein
VEPEALAACRGLGSWLVHVPVDQIEAIDCDERRIDLRSASTALGRAPRGPRRVDPV